MKKVFALGAVLLLGCAVVPRPPAFVPYHAHIEANVPVILFGVTLGRATAEGSGTVVARENGRMLVLTAAHVVERAEGIWVLGKKKASAQIVRADVKTDLALLDAPDDGSPVTQIADKSPALGTPVYILGSPFYHRYGPIISEGVVASREGPCVDEATGCYLITNMAGPGSSGGPVVTQNGELVGVMHGITLRRPYLSLAITLEKIKKFLFMGGPQA